MKIILIVSKKAESSEKTRQDPGTLTGVYIIVLMDSEKESLLKF